MHFFDKKHHMYGGHAIVGAHVPLAVVMSFAMGTSVKRSTSLNKIVDRAEGYDIPGEIVDGMNFREVRDKVAEVADSIRKESHPALLEVRTYRYRGHAMSDPASYRTKDELEKYRLDDPIIRL